jgi:hypothetical protein
MRKRPSPQTTAKALLCGCITDGLTRLGFDQLCGHANGTAEGEPITSIESTRRAMILPYVDSRGKQMIVTVGSKEYVIEGLLLGGQVPAWRLIKHSGRPMTHNQFAALPDADKRALAEHVQQYINSGHPG